MFCTNCGKSILDDSKFCPHCGTSVASADNAAQAAPAAQNRTEEMQPVQVAQPVPVAQPVQGTVPLAKNSIAAGVGLERNKRRGLGVLLVVAAVALAVLAAVILLLGSLMGGPKAKVGKAMVKSLDAHMAMAEALGTDTMYTLTQSKEFNQTASLELKELNDDSGYYGSSLSVLEGAGIKLSTSTSIGKRDISASAAAFYGSADLISASVQLKDNVATVYIPELMDDTAIGVDTMTLGKDLKKLDVDEALEEISFNLFDIAEAYLKPVEVDKAANKDFIKAIQVEKTGKESLEVNDHTVQCTAYHVVIPEDAMKAWLSAVKETVKAQNYDDVTLEMLRNMGVPEEEIEWIESDIKDAASGDVMFDALKDIIKELGDLELDVYLDGGYVMGVVWEDRINGIDVNAGVYLGGGKNYADDLSVEIETDSERIRFESSGDHSGKSGSYTDESRLRYEDSWGSYVIDSEMTYQPKKSEDNFSWSIKSEDVAFSVEGQLDVGKKSVSMQLDEVTVKEYGSELCTLEIGYSIEDYSAQNISAKKVEMLGEMSMDDLMELGEDVEREAMKWAEDLIDEVPELYEILMYM